MKKVVIGLVEPVKVIGKKRAVKLLAKIDTGAARSSLDEGVAEQLDLGPVVKFVRVKSAVADKMYDRRPVYRARIEIGGKKIPVEISTADRRRLKYKMIIGRDILRSNFIVDVEHTYKTVKR
ncbi:MAG: ATP-dependent zinc protease [Nanoarchaeota archaeon]|nr:ATP-dependent zinc protease [Nanoarchaeota archaeon]